MKNECEHVAQYSYIFTVDINAKNKRNVKLFERKLRKVDLKCESYGWDEKVIMFRKWLLRKRKNASISKKTL